MKNLVFFICLISSTAYGQLSSESFRLYGSINEPVFVSISDNYHLIGGISSSLTPVRHTSENYVLTGITGFINDQIVKVEMVQSLIPKRIILEQNYPNPFNPLTAINYDLPRKSNVTITIYDILGHRIKVLIDRVQDAGYHSVSWDGTNNLGHFVGSGIYLYRINADEFAQTKKMLLLR